MANPTVIHACPVVNQNECKDLKDELDGAVDSGQQLIVVDCAECRYLNSMAISEIMSAHVRLSARGGRLHLSGVSGFVRQCLDSVGALSMLHVYETVQDASVPEQEP